MLYQTRRPHPRLEPYVDCLWLLAAASDRAAPQPEVVLPDGKMELIIHFGDVFEKLSAADRFERQPGRSLFAGQISERIVLRSAGEIGMIAVRFRAGGASRFFRFPFHEIADQVVGFHDAFGHGFRDLEDKVLHAPSHEQRFALLEGFLLSQLARHDDDPLILQACRYIERSGGEYKVKDLVSLVGMSERQLERRFKVSVGLSPKMLSRIARFQRFMGLASGQKIVTLTDAAFACGYYDQAHFIRDFRAFAGASPTAFLSQPHEMSDLFVDPT